MPFSGELLKEDLGLRVEIWDIEKLNPTIAGTSHSCHPIRWDKDWATLVAWWPFSKPNWAWQNIVYCSTCSHWHYFNLLPTLLYRASSPMTSLKQYLWYHWEPRGKVEQKNDRTIPMATCQLIFILKSSLSSETWSYTWLVEGLSSVL